ncbi:MAG: flagellar biosynthesis protein FlhA [candidate division Zixibacteria bacterium]|nr:flagellar biosynthesis protein FlhA [candidate division Zixibacteria bacterium]
MADNISDNSLFQRALKHSDILLAAAVIGILAVLIIPVPTQLMDILLAFNITLSIVILLVTMYITAPLEISVFPGLLLIVTLFRLSLNVATTRLILGDAYAGEVVNAFGNFVVKGNYVVGFVIFLILVVIQFVVITKGATRIAEVAARFTLDAMPGKQMAIDADLNAGLIDDNEARRRRLQISREADFYGAMDGASKFVRGDAIAGILIALINIIGGLLIGVVQKGMPISQALQTYTVLTVGDGLVTQIPALVVSTGAGIIVTRAAAESNLGHDLVRQLTLHPRAIMVACAMLFLFAIVPGLPTIPFLVLGCLAGVLAYTVNRARKSEKEMSKPKEEVKQQAKPPEKPEEYLKIDTLEVEIGYGLIPLVDASQGGDLLDRVSIIRRQCAMDMGIIVPPIRIRDNIQLKPNQYNFKIKGVTVAGGTLLMDHLLAISPGYVQEEIEGISTTEPAFGLPAKWITRTVKELAESRGYTVVEPAAVLATQLTEVIKGHSHEILSRQDVQNILDNLKKDYPAVVGDVVPQILPLGTVQKVLQNLLKERVPIRDMVTILETLADYGNMTKEAEVLAEYVRFALARSISQAYVNSENNIAVFTLDPQVEQLLAESAQTTKLGINVVMQPEMAQKIIKKVSAQVDSMITKGHQPIALVSPNVRLVFRRFIESSLPNLAVLSYNEIAPNLEVYSLGVVSLEDAD